MSIQHMANLIQNAGMNAFGERVTYRQASGTEHVLTGIYSCPTVEMLLGRGAEDFTPGPRVEIRRSELAAKGIVETDADRISARGATHAIKKFLDDGQGGLTVLLEVVIPDPPPPEEEEP